MDRSGSPGLLDVEPPCSARYPCPMHRPRRHLSLLRIGFLALLVLGLVAKPLLVQIGELHAVEHARSVDADGHGHEHETDVDDEPDQDHTKGAHGLMHQANVGANADSLPTLVGLIVPPPSQAVPLGDAASPPAQHLSTPFRPPIG